MTRPTPPGEPPEANLHDLTDDDYFSAIEQMPSVYDADGNPVGGIFDDVEDRRAEKAAAAERGEEWAP